MAIAIAELIDRHEIWQVMLRYARGIDRLDRDMLRSCYHDDAVDDHGVCVARAEDFIAWACGYHLDLCRVHHHGLSNHYCEIDGASAHSETYYTFIAANRQPPHTLAMGRYLDRLEKRDGIWRIAARMCISELVCDMAETALPANYAARLFSNGPATRDRTDASYARPLSVRAPADAA